MPPNVPIEQYWSLTVYDRDTHALVKNVDRASRASNNADVKKNVDGSVDLYIGAKAPAGQESNWIPTDPARKFELMFRLYGPKKELFDKVWALPDVEKASPLQPWERSNEIDDCGACGRPELHCHIGDRADTQCRSPSTTSPVPNPICISLAS